MLAEDAKEREDCITAVKAGKRRPCKNCSCGARDMLGNELPADAGDMAEEPAPSACGNCGKGDAFRCSSCPYRGLPRFEGDKPSIIETADGGIKLDI